MPEIWMRRLMFQAYGLVLGVVVGKIHPLPDGEARAAFALFAVLLAAGLFGYNRAQRTRFPVWAATFLFVLSCFFLGWARYSDKYSVDHPNHLSKFTTESWKDRASVEGVIVTDPEVFDDRLTFTLNPIRVRRDQPESEYEDVVDGKVEVTVKRTAKEYYEQFGRSEVYGWRVRINAPLLKPAGEINPGGFSYKDFLADQDIYGVQTVAVAWGSPAPIEVLDQSEGFLFTEWALSIKERILKVYVSTIPYPQSTFLAGVTIGYRSALEKVTCIVKGHDEKILDECRVAGVTHVLAVSGQHVTIISGMLLAILTALRVPLRVQAPIIIVALCTFLVITGNAPSAMRATLMNSIAIFFLAVSRGSFRSSVLFGIAEAALVVLLINPKNITQPSFTLSFAAVLSLALISWPLERLFTRLRGPFFVMVIVSGAVLTVLATHPFFYKATRPEVFLPVGLLLAAGFAWCGRLTAAGVWPGVSYERLPAIIRLFTVAQGAILIGMMLPLSSFYFGRVSIAGPFANLIAIPLTGMIVPLGLCAGIVGMIPEYGLFVALVLNAFNNILCKIFFYIGHFSTEWFPYPFVENLTVGRLGVYYAAVALFVWREPLMNAGKSVYIKRVRYAEDPSIRRNITGMAVAAALIAMIGAWHVWDRPPAVAPGKLRLTFLSVPFGGSAVLLSPTGTTYLIDGGLNNSTTRSDVGEKVIAPYLLKNGISTIDGVIVTATGPEHTEGLAVLMSGLNVRRWYDPAPVIDMRKFEAAVSAGGDAGYLRFLADIGDPALQKSRADPAVRRIFDGYAALVSAAKYRGVPRTRAGAGATVENAVVAGKPYRVKFLAPGEFFDDYREQSAVLKIEYGKFSALFTGDAGGKAFESILARSKRDLKSDVMVIPNHGLTPASHGDALIEAVNPSVAVIQAGNFKLLYGKDREAKPLVDQAKDDYDTAMAVYRSAVGDNHVFDPQKDWAVVIETDGSAFTVKTMKGESTR